MFKITGLNSCSRKFFPPQAFFLKIVDNVWKSIGTYKYPYFITLFIGREYAK